MPARSSLAAVAVLLPTLLGGAAGAQAPTLPGVPDPTYAPGYFALVAREWTASGCGTGILQWALGSDPQLTGTVHCSTARVTYGLTSGTNTWRYHMTVSHETSPLVTRFRPNDGFPFLSVDICPPGSPGSGVPNSACDPAPYWFRAQPAAGVEVLTANLGRQEFYPPDYAVDLPNARPLQTLLFYDYYPRNWETDPAPSIGPETSLTLTFTPIPEPATLALTGLGVVCVAAAARRRKAGA